MYPNIFIYYFDLLSSYLNFVSYSTLIFNCLFCLIMIILYIVAFKNVRHIRSIPRQQIRKMTKKDFQLLRCLFVQDIVYILFSIPFSIFTVYQAATVYQIRTTLQETIVDFINHNSFILHHVPYCVSFYIFILVSKAFRQELKRMIYKIILINDEENIELNIAVVNHNVSY